MHFPEPNKEPKMTTSSVRPSRRHPWLLAIAPAIAILAAAGTASADEKCPPGSWFCADVEVKIGPEGTPPPAPAPAPPVVIYTPAPAPPPPPAYNPPPPPPMYMPPPRPVWQSETGLSFRLEGATFGAADKSVNKDVGMGGIGASLRFRPTPRFGFEIGIDALSGTDANGYKRHETPLSFLGMLYLNPRSATQVYLLGGFGFSTATVTVDDSNSMLGSHDEHYNYFGAIFGGGLEFRVARKIALNFDVRGFVRGRTDSNAADHPEFTAADGRTTNTSGGALFTGGLTFYF
jgi:opacity protein-like surface antigen